MSETSNLGLPFIEAAQAQKHVTHNEALRHLDVRVQARINNRTTTSPPSSPAPSDAYLVAATASGDWTGKENQIAAYQDNAWAYYPVGKGHIVWVEDEDILTVWTGTQWIDLKSSIDDYQNLELLGVNATADATNKLAVASSAVLFTHNGAGIQQVLNKHAAADTASVLFQTNWSGRAEMGLAGDDNFHFKVSPDGANFYEAIEIDRQDGVVSFPSGMQVPDVEFGDSAPINIDYLRSSGSGLMTNGFGLLGNNYNMPTEFAFDGSHGPEMAGAFAYTGHFLSSVESGEFMPVDPSKIYRLECCVMQDAIAGDWSAFANGERHLQYAGLTCYDVDKNLISSERHVRYRHNGIDSMTTLNAPLSPGDTSISVVDASGWNETDSPSYHRAITIFGYANSLGHVYTDYSRIRQNDIFDLGDVNKTTNVITLNKPLPTSMGNPNDVNGQWPVGTRIANGSSGSSYKFSLFVGTVVPDVDIWYRFSNYMGGVDRSGKDVASNFAPGTAFVKIIWLPNFSNRSGGTVSGYPDTGSGHKVRYSGISVTRDPTAYLSPNADGSKSLYRMKGNISTGKVDFVTSAMEVVEI